MEENNIETTVDSTVETQPTDATVNGVEDNNVGQATGELSESDVDNTSEQDIVDNAENKIDDGEKFAKAFSKRLNKEKEKLSKEFEPFKKVVSLAAKQFNMTEEEYVKSILEDYSDEDMTPKEKDEKDLLIEELLSEKKEKEVAREWERQIKALQDIDKNITIDKITDDMLILSDEKKIPLEYIYAHEMLTNNRKDFEKAIEDKIMAKINKVNSSSAGSMTSSKVEAKAPSINTMSKSDFEALKEKVKRGEKINL